MSEKKKKKPNIAIIVFIVVGMVCGFLGGTMAGKMTKESNGDVTDLLVMIISAVITIFIAPAIHEAGHLVMGLLTGYEFVSFRVGSLTIVKENGKLVRRKYNVAGTAGQCLMKPKKTDSPENAPYFWYHAGGVLFNLLTALLAACIVLISGNRYVDFGFGAFALVSVLMGLMNGIPMKAAVSNDGSNIKDMAKNPAVRSLMYKVMMLNGLQYEGVELCDMPRELTEFTEAENKCAMGSSAPMLKGNLLMNEFKFEESLNYYREAAEDETANQVYVNESKCEMMFCMIMTGAPKEEIDALYDKELQSYVKLTGKSYVMRKRLLYAYYLLIEKNADKAAKEYDAAVKMKDTYPAKGEYTAEMKLIEHVKEKAHEEGIS